ncbi:ketopantoate reductase family protein [Halomonas sp. LBP4]|uniref:ketopantoate reductase family protein n=1 Tax=Halomonas sp. LBP4 TaxID=2044917 RepID=UPI000D7638CD|nr:2-dehydropantoate 2-reductase [Halomonas sp. LBP4]PXX99445.1 2-dehydropantoate 2-reductase [Halomonas sp. LBP4]
MSAHLIVGPGALGRLVGLSLAKAGRVTLVGRRPLPTEQTLITPAGEALTLSVPTLTLDRLPPLAPDVVHLTTKAYAAEAAHAAIATRLAPGTPLVLWQNGFGCQSRLSERHDGPVLCATTTEGAWLAGDDRVVHAGHGATRLGDLANRHLPLARSLAATLTAAGLATEAEPDIRTRLWQKLAVNAAINPLVARFRIRNGQLRDRPFRPMVEAVIEEVATIMAAEGIAPPEGEGIAGWRTLVWQVVAGTAANRASMLQDVLAGRPTEREAILGPLLTAARRHGIEAPRLAELERTGPDDRH